MYVGGNKQLNGTAQTFLYLSPALGDRSDESDSRIYDTRSAHTLDVITELLSIKAMEGTTADKDFRKGCQQLLNVISYRQRR